MIFRFTFPPQVPEEKYQRHLLAGHLYHGIIDRYTQFKNSWWKPTVFRTPNMTNPTPLQQELVQLYSDLEYDIQKAGPICELSGRCCRFDEYGHTLFLSNIESELFFSRPPKQSITEDDNRCPYQEGALCTARENRPLGCRIFFCDPSYQQKASELSEEYLGRLKSLATRYDEPWQYAPLKQMVNQYVSHQCRHDGGSPVSQAPLSL